MATWNDVKVNVPGVGERAYVLSQWVTNNSVCTLASSPGWQCMMLESLYWDVGSPLEGVYPAVGDWVTIKFHFQTSTQPPMTNIHCYEVREIIDEATFNNGTCTACPATSDCGTNCVYTNNCGQTTAPTCITFGTLGTWPFTGYIGHTAGTSSNCSDCLLGIPAPTNPNTGNPPAWEACCGPHSLLWAGRNTEVFIPTSVGSGGWVFPNNNVIPLLPDDIGLPYCGFRGLNEPVSNGNIIVSPIDLWDDPQGWNQSQTIAATTNFVDSHSFSQYISQSYPYYDKMASQPVANFIDGIIVVPITGHTSLTSISPQPGGQTPTTPTYQEDWRGDGCLCSGTSTTQALTCNCLTGQYAGNYIDPSLYTSIAGVGPPPFIGYMDYINTAYGPTANFNQYYTSTVCSPGWTNSGGQPTIHCPDPNNPGMCLGRKTIAAVSNFGDPDNLIYGPLTVGGGGHFRSHYLYNFQEIVDWLNLVASTEGWAGGFTTSMTIWDLKQLAESQNTYTNQDYYNAMIAAGNTVLAGVYLNSGGSPTPTFTVPIGINQAGSHCAGNYTTTIAAPGTTDTMFFAGFELIEKYITHPTISNYGNRTTNVLASGSWDNIRNFLYGCGMPNYILSYADARPWFESNANSAAMGLQTSTNPLAYPDNAPNRVSIFNDVYLINKSLITRCPTGINQNQVGCTDPVATNYDASATVNCDGSVLGTTNTGWNNCCIYVGQGCGGPTCWDCNPVTYTCFVSPTGPYSTYTQCQQNCTDCHCIKIIGTGHTGTYHYTHQSDCDTDCCGGPSIGICDVLIVGDDEGVLHYDVSTDVATHLFSDNYFDKYDIAASFDKLWIYNQCFIAGTMIETPDGQTTIEQIKTGDIVKTFNTETNQIETSTVTETFVHPHNSKRLIINNKINTTHEHPFYVNGKWVDAGDLKIGDELLHIDGSKHKIISIETDTTTQTVYNFEVEGTHTYFAEGYLVHNKQNITTIKEYDMVLSPFSVSYNRTITIPALIGKGLTFHSTNKLLCANTAVQTVDITTTTGTLSTIFNLPGGTSCTGDILYTGTMSFGGFFIVLYGTANTKKVGKFNNTGVLIQDHVISPTILTGTTYFDSLFTDTDTNSVYGITNDARVYELLQNPIFQFAPSPVHNTPIAFTNNVTKTIHGADNVQWPPNMATEMSCSSGITIPVTYNCSINAQTNQAGCIDPGNGTGTYTGVTALLQCQNQTPGAGGCIVTWNCDPGSQADNCVNVQHQLPWPNVFDKLTALNYISIGSNNLQFTPLDQISFETSNAAPVAGQCFVSSQGGSHPQWRVAWFECPVVTTQPLYVWAYFINQCNLAGIGNISLSDSLGTVINKINIHFNLPNTPLSNPVIKIYKEACICDHSICTCYPVLGTSGQYQTEPDCDVVCCPAAPCIKCCVNKQGHQIQMSPNTNPCKCPFGWAVIPCGQPCPPNVSCAFGYHWSYVHCQCVCDQQACPWGWSWDEINCNCVAPIMASKIPVKDYYDEKSIDVTLARGDLNIEASAITQTNTVFTTSNKPVVTTRNTTTTTENKNNDIRYKITERGCVKCEEGQTDDFYTANNCIYTQGTCSEDTKVTYYICTSAVNPVDGTTQRVCAPQDVKPSSGTYYDNLEGCLNSGCAGFMWCEPGQSVNGVQWGVEETESYSPIPMCCESMIMKTNIDRDWEYPYTSSGPLTVSKCKASCQDTGSEVWYPLYNAYGTNVYRDSELAYLTRELLLQVNIGQCTVDTESVGFKELGYTKKNPY